MNLTAIYHAIDSQYCYSLSGNELLIKLRTARSDIDKVELHSVDKFKYLFGGDKHFDVLTMEKSYSDELFDYFEARLLFDGLSLGYCFRLNKGEQRCFYGNQQFYSAMNTEDGIAYLPNLYTMPVIDDNDRFVVPEWAEKAIVYQIFPERYYRGDDYQPCQYHADWDGPVDFEAFLGGNLQGIIDKLGYLAELGINTLYLTPIFQANYNHKYCTQDYFKIDPDFGDLATFKRLVRTAHDFSIRIILDAVFSSTGVEFAPFADLLEQQSESQYASWYKVLRFPVAVEDSPNYKCFAHFPILPKLNFESQALQDYLLSVLQYWIAEADIDGWRLDVADEVPHAFWRRARAAVKTSKADAVIIGEVWYDSTPWLQGDQFDSVMHYPFYTALNDYIAKQAISAEEFQQRVSYYLATYRKQTLPLLWNMIGSHDTARFSHLVNEDRRRQMLAAVIQFTFVGSPVIYYGDEVGLSGGNDPDNRRGMYWGDKQDDELLVMYRFLCALRLRHSVLSSTEIEFVENEHGLLHYRRGKGTGRVEVIINNNDHPVEYLAGFCGVDLVSGLSTESEVRLTAYGFRLIAEASGNGSE